MQILRTKNSNHSLYFIEELTVISWLFYILPVLIRAHPKGSSNKAKVYFIDSTRPGVFIARFTLWTTNSWLEQLEFRFIDVRDDSGAILEFRLAYRDLADINNEIVKSPVFQEMLGEEVVKSRASVFLKKRLVHLAMLYNNSTWRALMLVQLVKWKRESMDANGIKSTLFMRRRLWLQEIGRYASNFDIHIIPVFQIQLDIRGVLVHFLGQRNISILRRLKGMRLYFLKKTSVDPTVTQKLPQNSSPQLGVEYYGHLNLDRPELYSDLFFWQQSKLSGKDILVTFGIPRDPLDKAKLSEINKHGMTAVALSPQSTSIPSTSVFYHVPPVRRVTLPKRKAKTLHRGPEARYLKKQLFDYYTLHDYWIDFFARYNIKVYLTWYKYDATHCAIADALQNLGGVTAIYQRAFEEFTSPETAIAADVVFGHSKLQAETEQSSISVIPYYVITGYFSDHRFPVLRKYAQEVRNSLKKQGASRILAFFDENSGGDPRWAPGHDFTRENYTFLLEKILRTPWLGLVIKPKVPSTLRGRLGKVADLLRQAEKTGRCFIFESGALHSSYPPAAAALASDIAIHGHLCAATAGIEAALTGVPTVLFDHEGWHASLLYKLGKDRVIFNDWNNLWKACQDYWNDSRGTSGFGDWTPMLDVLDPFRDGRAAERIGTYLKWLLDGFKAGLSRDTVMADAAERYAKLWGRDKIAEVKGDK